MPVFLRAIFRFFNYNSILEHLKLSCLCRYNTPFTDIDKSNWFMAYKIVEFKDILLFSVFFIHGLLLELILMVNEVCLEIFIRKLVPPFKNI